MTLPVNNANFTTSASRANDRLGSRQTPAGNTQAGTPPQGEHVSLSAPTAEPAPETRIHSADAARAVLAQLKQQIAADPVAALAGHRGLNPNTAAVTLGSAA